MMKVRIETDDASCAIEANVIELAGAVHMVKGALIGVGYHPQNVAEMMGGSDED